MSTSVEEEFRRRLRLIMQQFGSVADLAKAVGVSDNAIYKWVSGRGQPSMASLVSLAQAAGVSVEWLATGHGPSAKGRTDLAGVLPSLVGTALDELPVPASQAQGRNAQVVDYLRFDPTWLQSHLGLDATQVTLIEAEGDSMSPTVDDGDLCLIDLRGLRVAHDGLYALYDGADLSIKRLQREPDGAIMIRSDNSAYHPLRVTAEALTLAGRVVWICGKP